MGHNHVRSAVSGAPGTAYAPGGFGVQLGTVIGTPPLICLAPAGSSLHKIAAASYWVSVIAPNLIVFTLALLTADVKANNL